jgi:hypothetical protein
MFCLILLCCSRNGRCVKQCPTTAKIALALQVLYISSPRWENANAFQEQDVALKAVYARKFAPFSPFLYFIVDIGIFESYPSLILHFHTFPHTTTSTLPATMNPRIRPRLSSQNNSNTNIYDIDFSLSCRFQARQSFLQKRNATAWEVVQRVCAKEGYNPDDEKAYRIMRAIDDVMNDFRSSLFARIREFLDHWLMSEVSDRWARENPDISHAYGNGEIPGLGPNDWAYQYLKQAIRLCTPVIWAHTVDWINQADRDRFEGPLFDGLLHVTLQIVWPMLRAIRAENHINSYTAHPQLRAAMDAAESLTSWLDLDDFPPPSNPRPGCESWWTQRAIPEEFPWDPKSQKLVSNIRTFTDTRVQLGAYEPWSSFPIPTSPNQAIQHVGSLFWPPWQIGMPPDLAELRRHPPVSLRGGHTPEYGGPNSNKPQDEDDGDDDMMD